MNITGMTIIELYELNAPMRSKLDAHIPLSTDEAALHEAICAEVLARLDAQQWRDRADRDALLENRYR